MPLNIDTLIADYLDAEHNGDRRLARILADKLASLGVCADTIWNQQ